MGSVQPNKPRRSERSGRVNSIGLDGASLDQVFNELDGAGSVTAAAEREFARWAYQEESVLVRITQVAGVSSTIRMACRNISRGGMSLLHSAYIHPGSRCAVALPHPTERFIKVTGRVSRCAHRRGKIHEIGIEFDEHIDVRSIIQPDPFAECFNLEKVNPNDVVGCMLHVPSSELDERIVRHFLRETQLRIRTAHTIDDAVQITQEGVDLVLTDHLIENASVADLMKKIRALGTNVAVIVATSDTSETTKSHLLELCADGFLVKPLSQDSLLRAVGEILLVRNHHDHDRVQVAQGEASEALVESFIRDLRQFSDRLDAAMQHDDAEVCRAICMQIKGAAPSLGFGSIGELAQKAADAVEQASDLADARSPVQALAAACKQLMAA